MLTDAHFHALDLEALDPGWRDFYRAEGMLGVASCHSLREYDHAEGLRGSGLAVLVSFGVHPQEAVPDELPNIERLASEGKLDAIGECGFDFYTEEYARSADAQRELFSAQAAMAKRYGLPLVLHLRKAVPELFSRMGELKGLKSVVFHAWPGSPAEARAILGRGVDAYFSFGAQAMNGRRLAIQSMRELPLDRILVESDAPYQKPRDKEKSETRGDEPTERSAFCRLEDLPAIYAALAAIRNMESRDLISITEKNLASALGKRLPALL